MLLWVFLLQIECNQVKPTTGSSASPVVYTKIFHSVNSSVHCAVVVRGTKCSNRCKWKLVQKAEKINSWRADFVIVRHQMSCNPIHPPVLTLVFQTQYHTNSLATVEKWNFSFGYMKTKDSVFPLLNYIFLSQNYHSLVAEEVMCLQKLVRKIRQEKSYMNTRMRISINAYIWKQCWGVFSTLKII